MSLDSPLQAYQAHLADGVLAFQRDGNGNAVFPPRSVTPLGRTDPLTWHESGGLGVIYAVSTVSERDGGSRHLALVDLDEGFRMLTEILGSGRAPEIGDRVHLSVEDSDSASPAPFFTVTQP